MIKSDPDPEWGWVKELFNLGDPSFLDPQQVLPEVVDTRREVSTWVKLELKLKLELDISRLRQEYIEAEALSNSHVELIKRVREEREKLRLVRVELEATEKALHVKQQALDREKAEIAEARRELSRTRTAVKRRRLIDPITNAQARVRFQHLVRTK